MSWTKISDDDTIQSAYESMRATGENHAIAEMLALRKCPALVTDTGFFSTRQEMNQFRREENVLKRYERIARRAGVNIAGKTYVPGLASFPGDPRAWVSTANGRSEIKKRCVESGYGAEGSVTVKPRTADKDPLERAPLVDPKIVDRHVKEILAQEPEKAAKVEEVQNQVIDRMAPSWRKRTDAAIRASRSKRAASAVQR